MLQAIALSLLLAALPRLPAAAPSDEGRNYTIYFDLEEHAVPLIGGGLREHSLRYGWLPCTCQDYTCGCCMSMKINFVNFSRNACMNFTYLPLDFAIQMNVLMNDESIFMRNVSAKNPPPACMEVPINYLPTMQFCIKLFDLYTPGRNLHMCVNFETRVERAPVLILEFDCFVMGVDGLSHQKPTESSESVVEGDKNRNVTVNNTQILVNLPSHIFQDYQINSTDDPSSLLPVVMIKPNVPQVINDTHTLVPHREHQAEKNVESNSHEVSISLDVSVKNFSSTEPHVIQNNISLSFLEHQVYNRVEPISPSINLYTNISSIETQMVTDKANKTESNHSSSMSDESISQDDKISTN